MDCAFHHQGNPLLGNVQRKPWRRQLAGRSCSKFVSGAYSIIVRNVRTVGQSEHHNGSESQQKAAIENVVARWSIKNSSVTVKTVIYSHYGSFDIFQRDHRTSKRARCVPLWWECHSRDVTSVVCYCSIMHSHDVTFPDSPILVWLRRQLSLSLLLCFSRAIIWQWHSFLAIS
jgi:hypothetical protein